jgi:hypothetical protein
VESGGTLPGWDVTGGIGITCFLACFVAAMVLLCWLERWLDRKR